MGIITRTHELKPASEAPGTFENINNVQMDFTDISTVVNGGLDTANLATSAKPSTTLGWWRPVHEASGSFSNKNIGLYVLTTGSGDGDPVLSGTAAATSFYIFPFNPADYAVAGLTAKCRVRMSYVRNSTPLAVGPEFTAGVYPISATGGGANAVLITLNSTPVVSVGPPNGHALHSATESSVSAEANLPTAGVYAFGVNLTTGQGVGFGQKLIVSVRFDVRHV